MERCRCQNTVDELVVERIELRDKLRELYETVETQERIITEQRVALAVLQKAVQSTHNGITCVCNPEGRQG